MSREMMVGDKVREGRVEVPAVLVYFVLTRSAHGSVSPTGKTTRQTPQQTTHADVVVSASSDACLKVGV